MKFAEENKVDELLMQILPESEKLTTASFKISNGSIDLLRDIVHTKKTKGDTEYTQTKALHEAIKLLAATMDVLERPAKIKREAKVKAIIISRGIHKRKQERESAPAAA